MEVTIQQNFSNGSLALCNEHCKKVLATLYCAILLGGTANSVMMAHVLSQRSSWSAITILITNLTVLHSIFLASLPFRLSYYFLRQWKFGWFACRLVSSAVHFHMYLSFLFYLAIIAIRLLTHFRRHPAQEAQTGRATALSISIWLLGTLTFTLVFRFHYGTHTDSSHHCFEFHQELSLRSVAAINYCAIGVLLATVSVLSVLQLLVLRRLSRALGPGALAHQELRAHGSSLFFLLVMVVCFLPHHVFRAFFIHNFSRDQNPELILYSEICKALTGICSLDMLCFLGGLAH
ncbi:probable G-protein coupled receptor 141 [Sarcophilus harrisii]|nr:probable G-protein coupled receptor 141 [Sarcophilus harrisii]